MSWNVHRRAFLLGAGCVASATGSLWPLGATFRLPGASDTPPPDAPAALKRWLGQYGDEKDSLTVYERDGLLHADGKGLNQTAFHEVAPFSYRAVTRSGENGAEMRFSLIGDTPSLLLDGTRLIRHDFGAELQARIRAAVHADADRLRAAALSATPPEETGPKRPFDLVSLPSLDPRLRLDIRYATRDNFMGLQIYERAAAFLQRPAAEALVRVSDALARKGYGLIIHDAYRPWFATKMFWDAVPPAYRVFVADPAQGSRHNRGCAVDLRLCTLADGRLVEMPGRYDEFSIRSFADFVGGTSRQRWHRDLLRREMEAQDFQVYPQEWWHFDHADWPSYGIGNASFNELANQRASIRRRNNGGETP